MKPNYAFKPIAEQALRSNQTIVPQRLNAALDPIMKTVAPPTEWNLDLDSGEISGLSLGMPRVEVRQLVADIPDERSLGRVDPSLKYDAWDDKGLHVMYDYEGLVGRIMIFRPCKLIVFGRNVVGCTERVMTRHFEKNDLSLSSNVGFCELASANFLAASDGRWIIWAGLRAAGFDSGPMRKATGY